MGETLPPSRFKRQGDGSVDPPAPHGVHDDLLFPVGSRVAAGPAPDMLDEQVVDVWQVGARRLALAFEKTDQFLGRDGIETEAAQFGVETGCIAAP